jgi:esterase/lipase superfamily enzyme
MRYMITNRKRRKDGFANDNEPGGRIHYLLSQKDKPSGRDFKEASPDAFADAVTRALLAEQKVLTRRYGLERDLPGTPKVRPVLCLYVHGYNNDFDEAVQEYVELDQEIGRTAEDETYRGVQVGFTWPSAGRVTGYPHDRREAVDSILGLYNLLREFKRITEQRNCIAETAVIAHSMGNYVLEETLSYLADEIGDPPGGGLIDQTLMVAADVDNDILQPGGLGEAIANFSYWVTVYFSRHDDTLRKSQRLKHKGKRRLDRNGPEDYGQLRDNVGALDCRNLATDAQANRYDTSVHSCYRRVPGILRDMQLTMAGLDREIIPGRQPIEGTNRLAYLLA